MSCSASSSGVIIFESLISITLAGPKVASSGISVIEEPPWMKCSGQSMCVPVCVSISSMVIVTGDPSSAWCRR